MPARIVIRRTPFDLVGALRDYLLNRSMSERSSSEERRGKGQLMEYIQIHGEEVEGGHREVYLDEPLPFTSYKNDKPVPKQVTGIKRQKRVSTTLDEARTMALLKEKGLLDECTEVVVVLNEDAVLAANYSGKITDDQLAALYNESESFAFYLITED
jgi:hypothetical protein